MFISAIFMTDGRNLSPCADVSSSAACDSSYVKDRGASEEFTFAACPSGLADCDQSILPAKIEHNVFYGIIVGVFGSVGNIDNQHLAPLVSGNRHRS